MSSNTRKQKTANKKNTPSAQTASNGTIWQRMSQRLRRIPSMLVQLPARVGAAWAWIKDNKTRLIWTSIAVATVLGTGLTLYIWRRELEALVGFLWGKVWGRIAQRWGRQTVVVVAESVSQDGVKRVVKKATTASGNGTGA